MGVFFASWQLWEEMTFVLACAIVIVFLIGLFKLWRTSRQMRRQEVIDEEKRARLTAMRRVSLSPTSRKQRNIGIPFGVRAIQTGVEVDGIWISRPTTPSRNSSKSKIVLSDAAPNGNEKASEQRSLMGKHPSLQHLVFDDTSAASNNPYDTHSNASTPLPQISEDLTFVPSHGNNDDHGNHTKSHNNIHATRLPLTHGRGALNEEALLRLEGVYSPTETASLGSHFALCSAAPQFGTYIPSSRISSPSPSAAHSHSHVGALMSDGRQQRTSTASANSLMTSASGVGGGSCVGAGAGGRTGSLRGHSNRSTSSHSSASSGYQDGGEKAQQLHLNQELPVTSRGTASHQSDPAGLPASYTTTHAAYVPSAHVSLPTSPLAFPGDAFANRQTRRVNPAFEVLPAGTFGAMSSNNSSNGSNGSNADDEAEIPSGGGPRRWQRASVPLRPPTSLAASLPPVRNKLRRASLTTQRS